ncbi:PIN domain-containing protein [Psychromonas sp. MME2]|uniref:PIN-like domain-containing protein n=1 Tax=unclassified Psychromonas TaxID=2614957 RepID=UPI00339C29F4
MKNNFPGYIDDYLENNVLTSKKVLVAFDTNILLNLYRYEATVVKEVLSQFKSLKQNDYFKLWLPHQVALEFNSNRKVTIQNSSKIHSQVVSKFKSFKKEIDGLAKIGGQNSEIQPLREELGEKFDEINNIITAHLPVKKNNFKTDSVIKDVYELFDGIVGAPYSKSEMEGIEEEGLYRYKYGIPPGFEDEQKEQVSSYSGIKISSKYGDLILWNQLIDQAIRDELTVILVTGDAKPDWVSKEFSRVRPELITEFRLKTGQDFYVLKLEDFQRHFKDKLTLQLSKQTTIQIKELTKNDNKSWLGDIFDAFSHFERALTLKEIYEYIYENSDRNFPPSWEVIIRRTIYNHCSDVVAYLGKNDYFEKLDSGMYKMRNKNT